MNFKFTKIQIKKNNMIFLFIICLALIFINNRKSYIVYAGSNYSVVKRTESFEILFDCLETKIEILKDKIDQCSKKKNELLKEIDTVNKELLLLNLRIKNKSNFNVSKSFLKYQISCLKAKKNNLKTNLYELSIEQIELELKLRKKLDFLKKK
ncbi:effector protein ['Opuntia sp.' phytoplasma]|uniref:effector protein n=1 Tax=Candidatus Phytoplasma asiaticum TaxID=2763338 RepID=UPI002713CF3C|nr:effector protein ['Opuntia sp.' phytoplasma]MDO8058045.1 effector protein ['Opuntia sp.' phytoplasma]